MPELKTAILAVELIVAGLGLLVLGDYLGYRIGRWRLATISGLAALVVIVVFVVFAAIVLT